MNKPLIYHQPTYSRIPDAGLTQLNFINTLPCQINVSYVNANQVKWIDMNATSYWLERDLKDQPMEVTAQLASPACGKMNFSTPTWTGMMKGASGKVNKNCTSDTTRFLIPASYIPRHFLLLLLHSMVNLISSEW